MPYYDPGMGVGFALPIAIAAKSYGRRVLGRFKRRKKHPRAAAAAAPGAPAPRRMSTPLLVGAGLLGLVLLRRRRR